jgi:hypothetical protein
VNRLKQADNSRPVVTQTLGDAWGLHLYDYNIDLGSLVTLVHEEAAVYQPTQIDSRGRPRPAVRTRP